MNISKKISMQFPMAKFKHLLLAILLISGTTTFAQMRLSFDVQQPSCEGYTNGQATVNISNGTAPYTFVWDNGQHGQTVYGLAKGTAYVTVTDNTGMVATGSTDIDEPSSLDVSIIDDAASCDDTPTVFEAVVSGGTKPYYYDWSTGSDEYWIFNPGPGMIQLTVSDRNGCNNVSMINSASAFTLALDVQEMRCSSDEFGIIYTNPSGGVEPYTFAWSNGHTGSYQDKLLEGTYTITATDATGCSAVASATLVQPALMQHTVTLTAGPCNGTTPVSVSSIGGTPPYRVIWPDGYTGDIHPGLAPGYYYVCVMDARGCTKDFDLTISDALTITAIVTTQDASCGNDDGTIDIHTTNGSGNYSYNWSDPNLSGSNPTNVAIGNYTVTVTDIAGCTGEFTATVNDSGQGLNAGFTTTMDNCDNNTPTVTFTPNNMVAGATYSWNINGQVYDGAPLTENFPQGIEGSVELVVSANGCESTQVEQISFLPIDLSLDYEDACMGDPSSITVVNNNSQAIDNYQWTGSSIVNGQGTSTIDISTDVAGDANYSLVATNSYGCSATYNATVSVVDGSQFVVDPTAIVQSQCDGLTVDLNNTNSNAGLYHWVIGDVTNPDSIIMGSSASIDFNSVGSYMVTLVPNANVDCVDDYPISVTVGQAAAMDFDFDFDACMDTTTIQFNDLSTTPTTITSWEWEFSDKATGAPLSTNKVPSPLVTFSGVQEVTASLTILFPPNCSMTLEKDIKLSSISINSMDSLINCDNAGVTIPLSSDPDYSFSWSPMTGLDITDPGNPIANPTETTVYHVDVSYEVSNGQGGQDTCLTSSDITVVVPEPIDLIATGDTTLCAMDEETMISALAGASDIMYTWADNPGFSNPLGSQTDLVVTPGTYYVLAENEFGCKETKQVEVLMNPADVSLASSQTTCADAETTVIATNNDSDDDITYEWLPTDLIAGGNGADTVVLLATESQMITLVATNQDGCMTTESLDLDVIDLMIDVSAAPDTIFLPESTELMVTEFPNATYLWSPAEGLDDPTSSNPIATPTETTLYSVLVTDENGCMSREDIIITVFDPECADPYVYIPNAFTPNDDGENDKLFVRGVNLDEVYFAVYNRWGEKVFDTNDQNTGWDGKFNGKRVSPDVYGYYLEVTCGNGSHFFKKGNISVIK